MPDSFTVSSSDAVSLAVHDFGGEGPDLVLCHATGLHGLVWGPVAEHLTDRYRCVAFDFRGHGDSSLPASGSLGWPGMADDVLAVVDSLSAGGPTYAAGWSMGGCSLVRAALERPGVWQAAWAMEPIIFGGPALATVEGGRGNLLADSARRRREVFADRNEAFANYASKPPFAVATPQALWAYVDHGFEDRPDGSVRLKCRGETEARVFEGSVTDTADRLADLDVPFTVVASGDGFPPAQVAPWVVDQAPRARLETMDDLTHFAPMEDPARVAVSIAGSLT